MWFMYALVHVFLLALVNYTDEWLANNNKLPQNPNIHTKVGSVLLISTLMSFVGAAIIWLVTGDISLSEQSKTLAILSAIPMVIMYAAYFYLIQIYPIHQTAPLWQLSSIWLLVFELISGGSITLIGLLGIFILLYGAYILDVGSFSWKIPTKLLFILIPASTTWATALFMVRIAGQTGSPVGITFWQMISIGVIGIGLFLIKRYRNGFIFRIQRQGKAFLGLSLANETFAESAYLFSNLAVAIAPVGAYVTSMSGVQSLFILMLFFLFPHGKRAKITGMQWVAVMLIAVGVFLIERR